MRIVYIMCSIFINLFYLLPCFSQISFVDNIYAEICEDPVNKDESSVYCIKDHKNKASLYVYKHIIKILLSKYGLNYNKIAIVEHSHGKPINYITYSDFFKKVLSFSHNLCTYEGKGIESQSYKEIRNDGKFKLLGLYGSNSINWLVSDLGSMISGVTTLVLHSKFSIDVIVGILNETKLEWICVDLDLVEGILERKKDLPYLKNVIILDTLIKTKNININLEEENEKNNCNNSRNNNNKEFFNKKEDNKLVSLSYDNEKIEKINDLKKRVHHTGINIILFDDMIKKKGIPYMRIKNEDPDFITSIVYTSGTSGKPKVVLLY